LTNTELLSTESFNALHALSHTRAHTHKHIPHFHTWASAAGSVILWIGLVEIVINTLLTYYTFIKRNLYTCLLSFIFNWWWF